MPSGYRSGSRQDDLIADLERGFAAFNEDERAGPDTPDRRADRAAPIEPAWSLAEPVEEESSVAAAEGAKEALSSQSETVGSVIDTVDKVALSLGDFRISLFDVLIVSAVIVGVLVFAWFASRMARRLVKRMTRLDDAQQLLVEKIVTIIVWAAAFFIGIDLRIDLTALAVFSGAFGLAIGFGLKTFGNLIAGIILLMDRSIKPGDVIAVADLAGNGFGQIRKIGIRAVSVTTRDQREYLIPNENLMINQVENWSYSSKNVRMQVPVGVSYEADMKLAEELMLEAAQFRPGAQRPAADRVDERIWRQFGQFRDPLLDQGSRRRRQRTQRRAQEAVVAVQGQRDRISLSAA